MATVLTSPSPVTAPRTPACARVMGVPVHNIDLQEAMGIMKQWIDQRESRRWIAVTSSHGLVEGFKRPDFKAILESADLSIPDGEWTSRVAAQKLGAPPKRIRGADLLTAFCELANRQGYSNYFYGDTDEVLGALVHELKSRFCSLEVAGAFSPPFRALSASEDDEIVRMINQAQPDVLWVGLGLPKQERWIHEHLDRLEVPVVVAIGAAFKFVSGKVKPAPRKVSAMGLEWLWRLASEPQKCWRRALVYGPQFALHSYLEIKGLRNYDSRGE